MKHTPGPWRIIRQDNGGRLSVFAGDASDGDDGLLKIATVVRKWFVGIKQGERSHAEADSNARLIAAAPDLLAALEEIATGALDRGPSMSSANVLSAVMYRAEQAIKQAKGETR